MLAGWNKFITDDQGNVLVNASITVIDSVSQTPATGLFADPDGQTPLSNPFPVLPDGKAEFYTAAGTYDVTAQDGPFDSTFANQQIGTAQARDVGDDDPEKLLTRAQADARYGSDLAILLVNTATFTLEDADAGKLIRVTFAGTCDVTLNLSEGKTAYVQNASGFPVNFLPGVGKTLEALEGITSLLDANSSAFIVAPTAGINSIFAWRRGRQTQLVTAPVPVQSGTGLIFNTPAVAPTIADGTEIWSQSFTSLNANSNIQISHHATVDTDVSNALRAVYIAYFRDSTLIGMHAASTDGSPNPANMGIDMVDQIGAAGTNVTYSARIMVDAAAVWYLNRTAAGIFGYAMAGRYTIQEL